MEWSTIFFNVVLWLVLIFLGFWRGQAWMAERMMIRALLYSRKILTAKEVVKIRPMDFYKAIEEATIEAGLQRWAKRLETWGSGKSK